MSESFSNRLSGESSPYLLQHAHNPVDWYPWGEEALARARREDKPILLSIGYSACHWCHVMEKESFEDPRTAALMNEKFVNIKIDREERPDLDHIYMDAVQAMTGSGGWPLHVFLTPERRPFYGGTYFPNRRAVNRPSWQEVLRSVAEAFQSKREQIDSQSDQLLEYLGRTGSPATEDASAVLSQSEHDQIFDQLMSVADRREGGFGQAPKFPQTFAIQFLLRYYRYTGNPDALDQACLSLDKMIGGGIHDQLGGGFARYSTDAEWLVPHFEKMLYDNALLLTALSEAFQLTRKESYREAIDHTISFLEREMLDPGGGFYSALDADSEGVEGKYYVWHEAEIREVLGVDAELFISFYGVRRGGNWEGMNILNVPIPLEAFAQTLAMDPDLLSRSLSLSRGRLLERREIRIRPMTDDKILVGWNALVIAALSKAYAATGNQRYRQLAVDNMDFLWGKCRGTGMNYFYHAYKEGKAKIPAFLDDYAFIVSALIQLQEITGEARYLRKAHEICAWVMENFGDAEGGFFYYTHRDQPDLVLRKKELYDGALPSGNAMMSINLLYLGIIFHESAWKERAQKNAAAMKELTIKYPGSFGLWATLLQAQSYTIPEIVITGTEPQTICQDFLSNFIPFRIFQSATQMTSEFPLLRDKPISETPQIFLCQDYSCQTPVTELDKLIPQLTGVQKNND